MRAISFKLKNGKTVKIRQVRGPDYDAMMGFLDRFSRGPGAQWTWQYAGQAKSNRAQSEQLYQDPNFFMIAAWDDNKIIGVASIKKLRPEHPYSARTATTGTMMLEKYTSNGLGNKFKQIIEKWARENNVHKLEAHARHKNIRSVGNLLKNGYEIVGISHDAVFIDGEYHHEYIMEKILEK